MDTHAVAPPGTVDLSTTLVPLERPDVSGGGKPALSEGAESGSIEEVLGSELERLRAEDAKAEKANEDKDDADKAEAKAKTDPKEQKDAKALKDEKTDLKAERARTERGQFAKATGEITEDRNASAPEGEQDGQAAPEKGRQSEGRSVEEPPARLLPRAQEQWRNVPNAVKADFQRIMREDDSEKEQYRASHDRYAQLKPFDDLIKSNGRDMVDSLHKLHHVENLIAKDPIAGLEAVLQEIGPKLSNGRSLTLYDIANHIVQNGPEAYEQRSTQARQAAESERTTSELETLKRELTTMKMEQAAAPIISAFRADNPRYDELQNDIAFFLESGRIPASLSPQEKLAAAYDMAERVNPRSLVDGASPRDEPREARTERRVDPAGQKSIRGAPSDGFDPVTEDDDTDLDALLARELRKLQRAS